MYSVKSFAVWQHRFDIRLEFAIVSYFLVSDIVSPKIYSFSAGDDSSKIHLNPFSICAKRKKCRCCRGTWGHTVVPLLSTPDVPSTAPCQYLHSLFALHEYRFQWNLREIITQKMNQLHFGHNWNDRQGSIIWLESRIDVKTVMPQSDWLHKFRRTYWGGCDRKHNSI